MFLSNFQVFQKFVKMKYNFLFLGHYSLLSGVKLESDPRGPSLWQQKKRRFKSSSRESFNLTSYVVMFRNNTPEVNCINNLSNTILGKALWKCKYKNIFIFFYFYKSTYTPMLCRCSGNILNTLLQKDIWAGDHTSKTLCTATIESGGRRGCGRTSSALLFSKLLNSECVECHPAKEAEKNY